MSNEISVGSKPITLKSETNFIVVNRFARHTWFGPFATLDDARKEAALLLATQAGFIYDVYKCVGSVSTEIAPMKWTDSAEEGT